MNKIIHRFFQGRQFRLCIHMLCTAAIAGTGLCIFYAQYHQLEIDTQKLNRLHSSNGALVAENQQLAILVQQQKNVMNDLNTLTFKIHSSTNQKTESLFLLKALEQQHQLAHSQFTFEKPRRIPLSPNTSNQYVVFSTPIHFQAEFIHEESLINFFNDLRSKATAIVIPDECHLQLTDSQKRLAVKCQMQWMSLESLAPAELNNTVKKQSS